MAIFGVTEILTGNKIKVGGWSWSTYSGTDVIIAGYNPTKGTSGGLATLNETLAKSRLTNLLSGKTVELGNVLAHNPDGSITCIVYCNGVDVAKYFPEYTTTSNV